MLILTADIGGSRARLLPLFQPNGARAPAREQER